LKPYLPKGGHILLTTRSKEWANTIPIDKLAPDEGKRLVQKLLQQEEPDAENLCKEFAYIPLGLVQACAYIRNQRLTISAYLKLLQASSRTLEHNEKLYGKELPYSMATLYKLTLKELAVSLLLSEIGPFSASDLFLIRVEISS